MTNRQRLHAVLNYENYDRMPVVHFGYWTELLDKWVEEGHLKPEEAAGFNDGNATDLLIGKKLGFDFNYYVTFQNNSGFSSLFPHFEPKRMRDNPDGSFEYLNEEGVIVLQKPGARSIPSEIEHILTDRASWEEHYLPRLQYSEDRFDVPAMEKLAAESAERTDPLGIYCQSLFGQIRNWFGVVELSYLYAEDEDLYDEVINTVGNLVYETTRRTLEFGIQFDFAHYWEDICFNHGPLVTPSVFYEKVGPHYNKINKMLNEHGINIVSLDCDGVIDMLVPTWIENGVNTMFPIEVGTWGADITPWREKYGKELRGVGGMNKNIFGRDKAAIDAEIERLKPLVDLGGFVPCPDHRIPPEAKWELVQYYCDRMKETF